MPINKKRDGRDHLDGMIDELSANEKQNKQTAQGDSESVVNQRMTIAGGFLDVALFVADVEHLKFTIDTGRADVDYYDLMIGLLSTSLALQIIVGVLLFVVGFGKNTGQTREQAKWTGILNNVIIGLVTLIAIVNIFVTVFGDRGEAIVQFRTRHHCDSTPIIYNKSLSINYNNSNFRSEFE